jgi:Protein of unknown function (DUF3606)
MLSAKHSPQRNAVDFSDRVQIRALIKRLNISMVDLHRIIEKSGNSIAAITKEAELERLASTELLPAEREQ